ncbi:MAG: nucleotidyltransferase domain-containing protein [Sedimentisphaerales bacterium]|jgi:predicted nucleotidyltransferase
MRAAGRKVTEIVRQYVEALRQYGVKVERVILYGSFAKGRPREDSDIDLVVVSESFQEMNLRERLEVLGMGAATIMKPIEAQGYTPKEVASTSEMSFLSEVLRSGISMSV